MIVNGWQVFAHPLLLDQIDRLAKSVEKVRRKDPAGYRGAASTKVLAALHALIFAQVPDDPTLAIYRQGNTLGEGRRHWFRAKFGNGRFRLFFRYDTKARIIVFAWVNDSRTLRNRGSRTDAYAVFRSMLDSGNPPDSRDALLWAARPAENSRRLRRPETWRA